MSHRPHRSADQWQQLIERQARSGETARAFCREHDLGYASFMQWRSRLADLDPAPTRAKPSPEFIELTDALFVDRVDETVCQSDALGAASLLIELDLGGGVQLRISRSA